MGTHTNIGVYRSIHGYICKYRGVQEYTMGIHTNTGVYRSIHGCT